MITMINNITIITISISTTVMHIQELGLTWFWRADTRPFDYGMSGAISEQRKTRISTINYAYLGAEGRLGPCGGEGQGDPEGARGLCNDSNSNS